MSNSGIIVSAKKYKHRCYILTIEDGRQYNYEMMPYEKYDSSKWITNIFDNEDTIYEWLNSDQTEKCPAEIVWNFEGRPMINIDETRYRAEINPVKYPITEVFKSWRRDIMDIKIDK